MYILTWQISHRKNLNPWLICTLSLKGPTDACHLLHVPIVNILHIFRGQGFKQNLIRSHSSPADGKEKLCFVRTIGMRLTKGAGLKYMSIGPEQYPLSYKVTEQGGPSDEAAETEAPCHRICGTIKTSIASYAMSVGPNFSFIRDCDDSMCT